MLLDIVILVGYDSIYDSWEEVTTFEGASRTDAVAFTNGERGFIALVRNSSTYFDDIGSFFLTWNMIQMINDWRRCDNNYIAKPDQPCSILVEIIDRQYD